jgi:hypothetical protein
LQSNEDNSTALSVYGQILLDNGKLQDALRVFLKLLIISPG